MIRLPFPVLGLLFATAACASDPQYITPQVALEAGPDVGPSLGAHVLSLPIEPERAEDAEARSELQAELGVDVPYVRREDLGVSIHWTLRNLSEEPGTALLEVNASNEWFTYVRENFVLDPEEDELPPPLLGGDPIAVEGEGQISGVIREDELARGALDLELMGRGGLNAFAAILGPHGGLEEFELGGEGGTPVPEEAFAGLVQFELLLTADRHMVLEYSVRVRDERGILHPALLDADPGELVAFSPVPIEPVLEEGDGSAAAGGPTR